MGSKVGSHHTHGISDAENRDTITSRHSAPILKTLFAKSTIVDSIG